MFTEETLRNLTATEITELVKDACAADTASTSYLSSKLKYGLCQLYGYSGVKKDISAGLCAIMEVIDSDGAHAKIAYQKISSGDFTGQEYQDFFEEHYKFVNSIKETTAAIAVDNSAEARFHRQHILALCYYYGIGVKMDKKQAVHWFGFSAAQGSAPAQYRLGLCYQDGIGMKINEEKAMWWYQLAIAQKNVHAEYRFNLTGARLGIKTAIFKLARFYQLGIGVEKNDAAATAWLKLANVITPNRELWDSRITTNEKISKWYYNLGKRLIDREKNETEAASHFQIAAELDYAPAQQALDKISKTMSLATTSKPLLLYSEQAIRVSSLTNPAVNSLEMPVRIEDSNNARPTANNEEMDGVADPLWARTTTRPRMPS